MTKTEATAKKPAKARKPKKEPVTLINFLLDKSGSMGSCLDATISGFNEFLGEQQAAEGKTLFSLTTFDTSVQSVHVAVPVAEVPRLSRSNYRPSGSTALYDAVASTIERVRDRVAGGEEKPDVVLFVIMTDGEENASREYDAKSLKPVVERAEGEDGWTFVFLGANQDAWAAGAKFGIGRGNSLNYDTSNMDTTFASLSVATTRLRGMATDALLSGDVKCAAAYQDARKDFWAETDKDAVKK